MNPVKLDKSRFGEFFSSRFTEASCKFLKEISAKYCCGGGVGVRVHGGPVIFQSGADAVRMKQR